MKDAQALLDQARNAVALGQASKLDVLMANAFLLEMKFRSKQISRKAYCKEALPKLREIATMSGDSSPPRIDKGFDQFRATIIRANGPMPRVIKARGMIKLFHCPRVPSP